LMLKVQTKKKGTRRGGLNPGPNWLAAARSETNGLDVTNINEGKRGRQGGGGGEIPSVWCRGRAVPSWPRRGAPKKPERERGKIKKNQRKGMAKETKKVLGGRKEEATRKTNARRDSRGKKKRKSVGGQNQKEREVWMSSGLTLKVKPCGQKKRRKDFAGQNRVQQNGAPWGNKRNRGNRASLKKATHLSSRKDKGGGRGQKENEENLTTCGGASRRRITVASKVKKGVQSRKRSER